MKQIIFIIAFCMGTLFMQAQTNVDSLINVLETQSLNTNEQIDLYEKICGFYIYSNMTKVLEYANEGIHIAKKNNNIEKLSSFTNYIGTAYTINGKPDSAALFYEEALSLAFDAKSKYQEASTYSSIARNYLIKSDFKESLSYYFKALTIYENLGKKKEALLILNNIGSTQLNLDNYEMAQTSLEKALQIAEEIDYEPGKMSAYYNLGVIYLRKDKIDIALEYCQNALFYSKSYENLDFQIITMSFLSTIYLENLGDIDTALKYALEALSIAEKHGSPQKIKTALVSLSGVYFAQNKYKECEDTALKAYEMDSLNLELGTVITKNISIANIYLGNKEKAIDFWTRYENIVKKYNEVAQSNALAEMEIKYETEKKETRIATLEKENQFYIWLGTAGAVLLLLAFSMLFYRYRLNIQKRKNAEQQKELAEQKNKQLEKEKQLIATQAVLDGETAERSRLAKDLHNRLGGLLTVTKLNLKEIGDYSVMEQQDIDRFDKALGLLDQSVVELHRIAHHLMPISLLNEGLKVAIEDFCGAISIAKFQYYGGGSKPERLDNRLEIILYQSAYELVNNAIKYAEANAINVQLLIDDGLVSLTIKDNGKGFDPNNIISGTGLENIRTHILAYNGKMNIHSSPDNGTEICIEIENTKAI